MPTFTTASYYRTHAGVSDAASRVCKFVRAATDAAGRRGASSDAESNSREAAAIMDERSQRAVAQLVGCGPQSGCIACPPTPEELRLSFFRCEEVNPDVDEGVPPGGVLQALLPAPGPGIGLVDSLMPQWDKTGASRRGWRCHSALQFDVMQPRGCK